VRSVCSAAAWRASGAASLKHSSRTDCASETADRRSARERPERGPAEAEDEVAGGEGELAGEAAQLGQGNPGPNVAGIFRPQRGQVVFTLHLLFLAAQRGEVIPFRPEGEDVGQEDTLGLKPLLALREPLLVAPDTGQLPRPAEARLAEHTEEFSSARACERQPPLLLALPPRLA
jgi:hypothetical protein